jgi:hypothetical protein
VPGLRCDDDIEQSMTSIIQGLDNPRFGQSKVWVIQGQVISSDFKASASRLVTSGLDKGET